MARRLVRCQPSQRSRPVESVLRPSNLPSIPCCVLFVDVMMMLSSFAISCMWAQTSALVASPGQEGRERPAPQDVGRMQNVGSHETHPPIKRISKNQAARYHLTEPLDRENQLH